MEIKNSVIVVTGAATRVGREVKYEAVGARLSEVARRLDSIAAGWDRRLARIKDVAEREG